MRLRRNFPCVRGLPKRWSCGPGLDLTPVTAPGILTRTSRSSTGQQNVVVGVKNHSKGTIVAAQVHVAATSLARLVGLLNRSRLEPDEGLWIFPSKGIHTLGMRFAIDVIFLDRGRPRKQDSEVRGRIYRVLCVYHRLAPWRFTRLVWEAESVLELAAGAAENSHTEVQDELEIKQSEG